MIFTPNRKPMRLGTSWGTFVVGRPEILGLNDSLKRSKVYKVTFSTPQQQLSFDQQKTSTSAGEEKS
jgi:hypothetical protein